MWSKCMSGRFFYTLCMGKHGGWYKTNFIRLYSSSHFPYFAASNAWQMGHNSWQDFFFLSKNCSLTLLPGSTWLQTLITCFYISCVASYRTHFTFLKRVGDLGVYQGFMMPINHHAGYKVQYSPKLMHTQELLFAFARRRSSCGWLRIARAWVLETARTSLRFFAVTLRKDRVGVSENAKWSKRHSWVSPKNIIV